MGLFKGKGSVKTDTIQQQGAVLPVPGGTVAQTSSFKPKEVEEEVVDKVQQNGILNDGILKPADFGELWQFLDNKHITDINWNGETLWIDDIERGRYLAEGVTLSRRFVSGFATKLSNVVSKSFNRNSPILEAETETLRISIIHESVSNTGTAISIRVIPLDCRITLENIKETNYCSMELIDWLIRCVLAHMSIIVGGLPGTGKTEFVKFLTQYIPAQEKVMTVEDTLELHYAHVNPGKDRIELKVGDTLSYQDAIKASLRQLPTWLLIAEARGKEAADLLQGMSTGVNAMTTIHTDLVQKMPVRIKNMVGDAESGDRILMDAYSFINVGVMIRKYKTPEGKIRRYIDQVGIFSLENGETQCFHLLVDRGRFVDSKLLPSIAKKFQIKGINPLLKPFENDAVYNA